MEHEDFNDGEWLARSAIADLLREIELLEDRCHSEDSGWDLSLLKVKAQRVKLRFERFASRRDDLSEGPSFPLLPTESESVIPAFRGKRILLVEDNAFCREALVNALQLWGFSIVWARTGESAKRFLDLEPSFDVGLFDLWLPGMSGEELARHCRSCEDLRGLKLVSLSGSGTRNASALFDQSLAKPIALESLRRSLMEVVFDEASVA